MPPWQNQWQRRAQVSSSIKPRTYSILTRGSLYNNPSDIEGKYGWDLNPEDDQHFPSDLQTAFDTLQLSGGVKDTYKLRNAAQNREFTNDAGSDNVRVSSFGCELFLSRRFWRWTFKQARLLDFAMIGLNAIRRKSPIVSPRQDRGSR